MTEERDWRTEQNENLKLKASNIYNRSTQAAALSEKGKIALLKEAGELISNLQFRVEQLERTIAHTVTREEIARAVYSVSPNGGFVNAPTTELTVRYRSEFQPDPWEEALDRHDNCYRAADLILELFKPESERTLPEVPYHPQCM